MSSGRRFYRPFGSMLLVATALALTGCSFFSSKQPMAIYALEPRLPAATGAAPVAWRLTVARPRANSQLSSPRILVMPAAGVIQIYPQAQWRDPAPALVGDLLLESFESSGRILGVDRANSGVDADYQLNTELRDFQLELQPGPPHAVVRIYARLLSTADNRIVAAQLFEIEVPAAGVAIDDTIAALNLAVNTQLPRITAWTFQQAEQNWVTRAPAR